VLNFAWFANVFFLLAAARLGLGKGTATKLALVSFVLAFDTFRFDSLLINEGGSTTLV
jgi:hypothetical protein